jgi:serine protease Do/serine protease DegQ
MKTLQQKRSRQVPQLVPVFSEDGESFAPMADRSSDDALLLDSYSQTIAAVVRRVAPSVVNIRVLSGERGTGGGSGFILARDGFILTNSHVVYGARDIEVTLRDARVYPAQLIGIDPETDLAVIRIDAPGVQQARLADSSQIRVGQIAVAVGSPYGFQQTVTAGIVSALGRSGINPEGYEDFIQTDASINPGNSGGALVNLKGELVGINSAILSGSGGNIGIGFAIPVNMVRGVMDQLIKYGQVKRGILGVNIYNVTPEIAKEFGLTESTGALVAGVAPGSSAERAGIKTGDIITSINGIVMKSASELRNSIGMLRVGDKVEIGLLRDGKPLKVTALVAERSEAETANAVDIAPGLEGAELVDAPAGSGVLVRSVQDGSPASQAGIKTNELIVGVGRTPISNTKSFREAAKGANVLVLNVKRGTAVFLIPVR